MVSRGRAVDRRSLVRARVAHEQLRFVRTVQEQFLRQSPVMRIMTAAATAASAVLLRLLLFQLFQQQIINGRIVVVRPVPQ